MLYEVNIPSGTTFIIEADSSKDVKSKDFRKMGLNPSNYRTGISSMRIHKTFVDYPETTYKPLSDDESLQPFVERYVLLYDEHHGMSTRA